MTERMNLVLEAQDPHDNTEVCTKSSDDLAK